MIDSYELIIEALRDPIAVDVRLRHVLKSLLRQYRFRCKSVKRVDSKKFGPSFRCGKGEKRLRLQTPGRTPNRAAGQSDNVENGRIEINDKV